jgi:hypothetical protein
MPGFTISQLESPEHCFLVARGWPASGNAEDPTRPARDEIRVAVHDRPRGALLRQVRESPPAPVAGMVPFARIGLEEGAAIVDADWQLADSGPHAGWLLLKTRDRSGSSRLLGLPFSTCALWRQGRELQALNPAPGEQKAGVSLACAATVPPLAQA